MKAVRFERRPARVAAAMAAGRLAPGGGASVGPLRLVDAELPELPGEQWVAIKPRLAGICGSDLATIDGTASRWFEPVVSFPFTPGHEVVADGPPQSGSAGHADGPAGDAARDRLPSPVGPGGDGRVVLEPVLGCVARGVDPPCTACAAGHLGNCERIAFGALPPGLQSGYCCATGGGWSTLMVAHRSQLHPVPESMSDEAAVLVEPTACALHAVLACEVSDGDVVVVLGAGTLGLLCLAALRHHRSPGRVVVVAKHEQQRALARTLGADDVVSPAETRRAARRATGSLALGEGDIVRLTGGADVVFDCVGSERSLHDAIDITRPRGRITLVGMAGRTTVDLTGLWQRELQLGGAYAYGTEHLPGGERRRTFDLAFELVDAAGLERLLSATYPLERYRDAVAHAAAAGARGAVKVAFDLRDEKERDRL